MNPTLTSSTESTGKNALGNPEIQQCIQNCLDCYQACTQTIFHCLSKGGKHAEPDHIRELMNCAQICLTSANFMMTGSPMHMDTCGVCAKACESCVRSCAQMADGDPVMEACMEACQRCVDSCRKMSH